MTTLKFERVKRECDYNKRATGGPGDRYIYDFNVLIDGEHRAIMSRNAVTRGYRIYDTDHRAIRRRLDGDYPKHLGSLVETHADFEPTVRQLLDHGLIPTLAEMADKREAELRAKEAAELEEVERKRIAKIEHAAVPLYDAAKQALVALESRDEVSFGYVIAALYAAIKKAEEGE